MTRHLFPVIAAVLLSATALVGVIHPVAATQPLVVTEHFEGTFLWDCGSIVLVEPLTVDFRTTVHFDADGNPVRAVTQESFLGWITNPDTGETVRDDGHNTRFFDYATGELTVVGGFTNATIPGEGTVLRGVGRITIDASGHVIFSAGDDTWTVAWFVTGDYVEVMCAALLG